METHTNMKLNRLLPIVSVIVVGLMLFLAGCAQTSTDSLAETDDTVIETEIKEPTIEQYQIMIWQDYDIDELMKEVYLFTRQNDVVACWDTLQIETISLVDSYTSNGFIVAGAPTEGLYGRAFTTISMKYYKLSENGLS